MLDATHSRLAAVDGEDWLDRQSPWRDVAFRTFVENVRQRRQMLTALILVGAIIGSVMSLAYVAVRVSAYSASSEILISNTTLQLSGPDAVVTQILVENSLVENAIELLRSGSVLGRVIDKVGLDQIERISPRSMVLPWNAYLEPESSTASKKQALTALLRANTTVKRVGSSQIVTIRARAVTAVDAAKLTNDIAGAFVQEQYDSNAVVSTSAALRERIKVLGPTARIISEAVPPKSKDTQMAAITILFGIVLGGAIGAVSGLFVTLFDRRVRVAEQLSAITSVECFGYIPLVGSPPETTTKLLPSPSSSSSSSSSRKRRDKRGRHLAIASAPRTAAPSNSNRIVRFLTNPRLRFEQLTTLARDSIPALQNYPSSEQHYSGLQAILKRSVLRNVRAAVLERSTLAPRIVGVTSCRATEGKTTLAGDLARFVAREGEPALLIDTCNVEVTNDQVKETPGLRQLLRGTVALDDVIQRKCSNLDFLPSGRGSGDIDLLWNNLVHAINDGRKSQYQWIILDLPELASAADVRAAGQVFDDLLIVVEWGRTSQGRLQRGLAALGSLRERIVGTVINKAPWTSIDSATASLLDRRPACHAQDSKVEAKP